MESDEAFVEALQALWEGLEALTERYPRGLLHAASLFHLANRLAEAEALVHFYLQTNSDDLEAWLFLQGLASLRGHAGLSGYCIEKLAQLNAPEPYMILGRARDAMLLPNDRSHKLAWELADHPINYQAMAVLLQVAARFNDAELVNKATSINMPLALDVYDALPKNARIRLQKLSPLLSVGTDS